MIVSNIAELVQKINFFCNCFFIVAVVEIIMGIIYWIKKKSPVCFFIATISLLIILFAKFFLPKFYVGYYIELDKKINVIAEEPITTEEKKEKIIKYLETEKLWGNIRSYENFDNSFKIDSKNEEFDSYKFTITDSE